MALRVFLSVMRGNLEGDGFEIGTYLYIGARLRKQKCLGGGRCSSACVRMNVDGAIKPMDGHTIDAHHHTVCVWLHRSMYVYQYVAVVYILSYNIRYCIIIIIQTAIV
jgi:hypothetical protein